VRMSGQSGPLADGAYPLTNGAAFWHDGVAYHVLQGHGTVRVTRQRGAWSDCGVGPAALEEQPVLNAGLDHGRSPSGASYAYVVLPGAGPEAAATTERFVLARLSLLAKYFSDCPRETAVSVV
jgi:hypothetical protein